MIPVNAYFRALSSLEDRLNFPLSLLSENISIKKLYRLNYIIWFTLAKTEIIYQKKVRAKVAMNFT